MGLDLILKNNFFVYNKCYHLQLDGTPMGSCLTPSAADLVMDILLDDVVTKISFELPFLKKDVDDLITTVPIDKVNEVLTAFNSYNPRLQFTVETEVDGKLPFLDMMVQRNTCDGSVRTFW